MSIIENNSQHVNFHFENDKKMDLNGIKTYLNYWALKQQHKEVFTATVDTSAVKDIDLIVGCKNAMTIGKFVKKMKKQPIQYLKYTILVIGNKTLIGLLDMIFKMTKPCASVYVVETTAIADQLYEVLERKNEFEINAYLVIHEITYVKPK